MDDRASKPAWLRAFAFRSVVLMDQHYAGWAIQKACDLVPLAGDEAEGMLFARGLRRHHLTMPELADRVADLRAVHAAHDVLIAARDCASCKRFGCCPATTHLQVSEDPAPAKRTAA